MTWTQPDDLMRQVQRLWDRGMLLRGEAAEDGPFPLRLSLRGPSQAQMREQFQKARTWIAAIEAVPYLRLEKRAIRHLTLGTNAVPDTIWLDSVAAAVGLLGKAAELARFEQMQREAATLCPQVLGWLSKQPLVALGYADSWLRLLQVVVWLQRHPRPGIYLRQVDIAGIDSKFIEGHLRVLSTMLDCALPAEAIAQSASGARHFARRYGFRGKAERIRFRTLDAAYGVVPGLCGEQDITLDSANFCALNPRVRRVFVCENETNFLAFPPLPGSWIVFAAGYGASAWPQAAWLQDKDIYYWGDIDTHGFAILDTIRGKLPHMQSLLMDESTLLAHRAHWGREDKPLRRALPRLTPNEQRVYTLLCAGTLADRLRLEQERVSFGTLLRALDFFG